MLPGNLTSLARVKRILGISDTSADAVLADLIFAQSRRFLQDIGRKITYQDVTETLDGSDPAFRVRRVMTPWFAGGYSGGPAGIGARGWAINLSEWPVLSVSSVTVDGGDSTGALTPIPQATNIGQPTQTDGWALKDSYRIELVGQTYAFTWGVQNVVIVYKVGFTVTDEAQTIPTAGPYTLTSVEAFYSDIGVKFADGGAALTVVTTNPAQGEYSVDSDGTYTFNSADTGKGVLISYAYIPGEVEQAVKEMVAWKYAEKDRFGQRQKSIDGGTVTFMVDDVPPYAASVIQRYARVQV